LIPGPIQLHTNTEFIYFHLAQAGLTSRIVSRNLFKLSFNFGCPKDNLPNTECTLPCLSFLNSNFQATISLTAETRSSETVPVLGFGIRPFGP
jgi:hypothetical protein